MITLLQQSGGQGRGEPSVLAGDPDFSPTRIASGSERASSGTLVTTSL